MHHRERIRREWALRPWFWCAMAVVLPILLARHDSRLGVAAVLLLGVLGVWLLKWRGGLVCGLLPALLLGWYGWNERLLGRSEAEMLGCGHAVLEAVLLREAQGGEHGWSGMARVTEGRWEGQHLWWQGRGPLPLVGAKLRGRGDFQPLPHTRNAGEFDRAGWMRLHRVVAVFDCRSRVEVVTPWWAEVGAKLKQGFRERVSLGLEPTSVEAMVLRAVVIGETPQDADPVVAAFRESGTLHAFSVSGLHVAMVGALGWWVLAHLGMRRSWAVAVLIPLVFGYAWLTGNSAPAVRSAWMAAVFLAAFPLRRRVDLLNTLGLVLCCGLFWDPRMVFLPGVQLSYGVVAAIALGSGVARRVVAWLEQTESYLPNSERSRWQQLWLAWRTWLAQSLAVGLAAGVGSAPLTALHFGMVTPISVLAGLVLIPLVFVMLAGSFAVVLLSPLGMPATWLGRANGQVAALSVAVAKGFAAVPGGHLRTRVETEPTLRIFDLERGAGALSFSAGGAAVLWDAGNAHGFRYRVAPALRHFGLEPDAAIFSHPDGNHLGGGLPVWEAFPIRQVVLPVQKSLSPAFRRWRGAAATGGIRLLVPESGRSLPMPDGARLELVQMPDPDALRAVADERVMIARLHWRGWRILYSSDAGQNAEDEVAAQQRDVRAEVLVIGRHRSGLTLGEPFFRAVAPKIIVASNDAYPESERLPASDVAFWRSCGVQVWDQQDTGGVTMRVREDGSLWLHGHVNGAQLVLPPTAASTR